MADQARLTRDELINRHAHLVPLTRQRLFPRPPSRIEADDLESEGYIGLVRAADRYDPSRGTAFRSWAITAIRGAMLEYVRNQDWCRRATRERLEREGEEPLRVLSLDAIMQDEESAERRWIETIPDPGPTPEEEVCERWEGRLLARAIGWLPVRERRIVWLTEAEGLTCRAVSELMGMSESRVWQLRAEGRRRLRWFAGIAG